MPLEDSQLVGLLRLLIEREKDVMLLKAHVLALEIIAVQLGGDDIKQNVGTCEKFPTSTCQK